MASPAPPAKKKVVRNPCEHYTDEEAQRLVDLGGYYEFAHSPIKLEQLHILFLLHGEYEAMEYYRKGLNLYCFTLEEVWDAMRTNGRVGYLYPSYLPDFKGATPFYQLFIYPLKEESK